MTAGNENTAADWISPWPINRRPIGHLAPLGTACALLLSAMLLAADSNIALVGLPDWRSRSWLQSELERALSSARASMVELPADVEPAAVAQLASKVQMVSLESRQVAAVLRALQANYADLERERKTKLVELERSIHWTQDQIRRLQEQHDMLMSQTEKIMDRLHSIESRNNLERHVAEVRAGVSDATANHNVSYHENVGRTNDETSLSTVTMTAMWIANGLRQTREEALLSGEERSFTLDVDKKLFKSTTASHPVLLGSDLDLTVYIAKSELIDGMRGNIRFFPDGSSTGGRIDLDRHGEKATVVVEWSTGAVDIEKSSLKPHLIRARKMNHMPSRMRDK